MVTWSAVCIRLLFHKHRLTTLGLCVGSVSASACSSTCRRDVMPAGLVTTWLEEKAEKCGAIVQEGLGFWPSYF